jgi:hypothetical protein
MAALGIRGPKRGTAWARTLADPIVIAHVIDGRGHLKTSFGCPFLADRFDASFLVRTGDVFFWVRFLALVTAAAMCYTS